MTLLSKKTLQNRPATKSLTVDKSLDFPESVKAPLIKMTGREVGGCSGWGAHVHLWWIHVNVWQNQYNIVKLKIKYIYIYIKDITNLKKKK